MSRSLSPDNIESNWLMFDKLCRRLSDDNLNAILLDVAAEEYEKIKKLTSDGYKVDKLDCIFPVKVEIIRE